MMTEIKTYELAQDDSLTFEYQRMEILHEIHEGKTDLPHRHNYYTIIRVESGKGLHRIDFQEYKLENNNVFFIAPNQIHQLIPTEKPFGEVIKFSKNFLHQNNIRESFISDVNLFQDYGYSPPLPIDEIQLERLQVVGKQMQEISTQNTDFSYEALGALLKLFLIYCNNACSLNKNDNSEIMHAGVLILREFKDLVEQNYTSKHQVKNYAEMLAVSSDHLNKTIRTLLGKTAKEYIQNRIIVEAKRLLLFSQISAKELAWTLGFEEPSHFSAFFKKCTGESISAFRAKLKS